MSSLLADDYLVTLLASMHGDERAKSRLNANVAKRLTIIGALFRYNEFGIDNRLGKISLKAEKHFFEERTMMHTTEGSYRLAPDNSLLGNTQVWIVLRKCVKHFDRIMKKEKPVFKRTRQVLENSITSCIYRTMHGGSGGDKMIDRMGELVDSLSVLPTLDAILYEKMKAARNKFNYMMKEWAKSGYDMENIPKHDFTREEESAPVACLSFGLTMVIRVCGSMTIMPDQHAFKLIALFKTWTDILMMLPTTTLRYNPIEFFSDYLEVIRFIIDEDTDFLGEVLKGAKNIAVAKLDTSDIIGVNMFRSAVAALKPARREFATPILDFMRSAFTSIYDVINMLNCYKAVPHPDTNLFSAFETIEGLHSPNTVDPAMLPRFRGTLRRSIYHSLATASHDVRLDGNDQASIRLAEEANKTNRSVSAVCDRSTTAWSGISFQEVRGLTKPSDIFLDPSDKSSQVAPEFSQDDLDDSVKWSRGEGSIRKTTFCTEAHTINDAASYLKGHADFDTKKAIKRFERVTRMHEAFEARYPGMQPEEIPEVDLQEFVVNNPDARYLVGTEPKLGEYHKKVTRIFYMAEQDLKIITQITERTARQISRKQAGVSIVKGYRARRLDLENFAGAVTGPEAEKQSIFTSFDMSEFSKRFPMVLVREYGQMLAEITGESWMARIDLVFRAAVVIHNTRGYFNFISGVKGAFEGFLNFVWSSIHAVVMEIALAATGLKGMILVYSDDGLLLFYSPVAHSVEDNYRRVMAIRDTYAKYGLVFHLGKTLISSEVWEYLGDVCHNGKMIPGWMKEISSVGVLKTNRGLAPLRMRVSSFEGQVAAAVASGADPVAAYILLRFTVATYLANFMMSDDNRFLEALMIIPVSLGGMRIRSPMELCLNSDIDTMSEFIADLECLRRCDAALTSTILYHLPSVISGVKPQASRLLMGNLISSNLPDTSGMNVIMRAIEMVTETVDPRIARTIGLHPVTPKIERQLTDVLKNVENIDHKALAKIVMSLPPWIKFTKSMALVRGSGAIKLISRRELKRLQGDDTKQCQEAFRAWKTMISLPETSTQSAVSVIQGMVFRANRGFDVVRLKMSPRMLLSPTVDGLEASITVRYSPGSTSYPYDLHYREPRINFPNDVTTLSWYSEATGDVDISAARRFQDACASFASYSPDSIGFLRYLGNCFGVSIPLVPNNIVRGLHRRSSKTDAPVDIRLVMPRPFWALSSSNFVNQGFATIRGLSRADRRTYIEASRVFAYFQSRKTRSDGSCRSDIVQVYHFAADQVLLASSCSTEEMIISSVPDLPFPEIEEPERLRREFIATMAEYADQTSNLDIVEQAVWDTAESSMEDLTAMIMISINTLSRWIHDVVMTRASPILAIRAVPVPPFIRNIVFRKAITSAMWMSLDPRVRGTVGANIRMITRTRNGPATMETHAAEERARDAFAAASTHLNDIIRVLKDMDHPIMTPSEIDRARADMGDMVSIVSECVMSASVFSEDKVIVVRSANAHANYMTESHRVAYKQIFSSTLTSLTNSMRDADWRAGVDPLLVGMNISPDDALDWLHICRTLIRASPHRTTHSPYNKTSATIEMYKFYVILKHMKTRAPSNPVLAEAYAKTCLLTPHYIRELRRCLTRFREPLGPDHEMMLRKPLSDECISRLMMHHREFIRGHRYGTYPTTNATDIISWVRGTLHVMYQSIILRASTQLMEVPVSFVTAVNDMPPIMPFASAAMSSVSVPADFLSGYDISDATVARATPIVQLLSAHIANFAVRSGLHGLDYNESTPPWLSSVIVDSGHYGAGGPVIRSIAESVVGDVSYVVRRYTSVDAAFASYVTMARIGVSSLSLIKNPRDNLYYIVGVYNYRDLIEESEDSPNLTIESEEDLNEFIPSVTFAAEADMTMLSVRSLSGARSASRSEVSQMGDHHLASASYARHLNRSAEFNDSSIFIQAAADLARDATTSTNRVWAYTLFLHFMNRDEDTERAVVTYHRLAAVLNRGTDVQRGPLILDVSLVTTWLKFLTLYAAESVPHQAVANLMNRMPNDGIVVNIQQTMSFQRTKSLTQVKEMLNDVTIRYSPGRLMGAIILIEQIAIMPASQEEDNQIDPSTIDMDNFWE